MVGWPAPLDGRSTMARSSVDEPLAVADQQAILQFMTTEHFTLQRAG
jgi:hypothetical protein